MEMKMEMKMKEQPTRDLFSGYVGWMAVVFYLSMFWVFIGAVCSNENVGNYFQICHSLSLVGAFLLVLSVLLEKEKKDDEEYVHSFLPVVILSAVVPLMYHVGSDYSVERGKLDVIVMSMSINLCGTTLYHLYVCVKWSRRALRALRALQTRTPPKSLLETPESTDPLKEPFIV